jgi:hypothetical protein
MLLPAFKGVVTDDQPTEIAEKKMLLLGAYFHS